MDWCVCACVCDEMSSRCLEADFLWGGKPTTSEVQNCQNGISDLEFDLENGVVVRKSRNFNGHISGNSQRRIKTETVGIICRSALKDFEACSAKSARLSLDLRIWKNGKNSNNW